MRLLIDSSSSYLVVTIFKKYQKGYKLASLASMATVVAIDVIQ